MRRRATAVTAAALAVGWVSAAAGGPRTYDVAPLLRSPSLLAPPQTAAPPDTVAPAAPAAASRSAAAAAPLAPFPVARDRWYAAGSAGLALPRTADANGTSSVRIDFNNGGSLGGAIGYAWRNGFRVEGQVQYLAFSVKSIDVESAGNITGLVPGSVDPDGTQKVWALTANLAYDFETGGRWSPFVIGGVGIANVSYDTVSLARVGIIDDGAWMMAFQFGGGIAYLFTDRWSVEASYRYLFTLDPTLSDAAGDAIETEFAAHTFVFGARYGF